MEQQFANRLGFSDVDPYEVLRVVKPGVIEIREMKCVQLHKAQDLGFQPGGFFGHCAAQDKQRWDIQPDPEAPVKVARLCNAKPRPGGRRRGFYYDAGGNRYQLAAKPVKFYDYNF